MLSMSRIRKVYRTELVETHALDDFSLDVDAGEFVAVMGRSGSGKTTFLNVAGLLDTFDGGDLPARRRGREPPLRRRRCRASATEKIGFIFQSFNLIPDLDVFDNVDVPLRYRACPAASARSASSARSSWSGLSSRACATCPSQLSGGQQQRVAIARVLAGDPKLILADEPTGNLDSLMTREIMDLLERINEQGTTIVMVTHSPECAARAHRQIHLLDGRVVDLDAAPTLSRARADASRRPSS